MGLLKVRPLSWIRKPGKFPLTPEYGRLIAVYSWRWRSPVEVAHTDLPLPWEMVAAHG